jgi:hypothetical protein
MTAKDLDKLTAVETITKIMDNEWPLVVELVKNSPADTTEGRRSRERLRVVLSLLRRLARETESARLIDITEH